MAWQTAALLIEENWCFEIGDQLESRKISQVYRRAIHRQYLDPGDNVDKHNVMKCQCASKVRIL